MYSQVHEYIRNFNSKHGVNVPFIKLDSEKYLYLCTYDKDNDRLKIIDRYDKSTGLSNRANKPFGGQGDGSIIPKFDTRLSSFGGSENGGGFTEVDSDSSRGRHLGGNVDSKQDLPGDGNLWLDTTIPLPIRNEKGGIFGWSVDGEIYLTPKGINSENPIHEYTHLWSLAMQRMNPDGWSSIVELLKNTNTWNEVVNDKLYADLNIKQSISPEVQKSLR